MCPQLICSSNSTYREVSCDSAMNILTIPFFNLVFCAYVSCNYEVTHFSGFTLFLIHVHAVFSDPLSAVNSLPFCVHLQTEGRTKEVLHSLGCLLRISIEVLSKCLF